MKAKSVHVFYNTAISEKRSGRVNMVSKDYCTWECVLLTWSSWWLELEPVNPSARMTPLYLPAEEQRRLHSLPQQLNALSSPFALLGGQNPTNSCCIPLKGEAGVPQGACKLTLADETAWILPLSKDLWAVRSPCTSLSTYGTQASHERCSLSPFWQKQRSSVSLKSRLRDFSQHFSSYEI